MQTQSRWARNNQTYRDRDYSPAKGVSLWETCPQLAALDPAVAFTFFDDFFEYEENNANQQGWIATKTQAGSSDAAITASDAAGGVLSIVNDNADDDSVELQWNCETFKLATSKPCWFEARLQVSSASATEFNVGLCITDTTLIAGMTDGVYFRKKDADTSIFAVTEKNSTETETDTTLNLSDSTYVKLGFWFDGAGSVLFYVDGVLVTTTTTNIPDDEELAVSIAFQNGTVSPDASKTMLVDYVKVVQVR